MTLHSAHSDWLQSDALDVAPALIGWRLETRFQGAITSGRITEVEAYLGADDPASHASRGPTSRNAPMFMAGGSIYVYLSYGIHRCINLVTGPEGKAQAVLIRAIEPLEGMDIMAQRRSLCDRKRLAQGPGNVCQALGIMLSMSGNQLGDDVQLLPPLSDYSPQILATTRIGIRQATDRKWRFVEAPGKGRANGLKSDQAS